MPGQDTNVISKDKFISTYNKLFEKNVRIKRQNPNPDTEVRQKAGMQSMHTVLYS